MAQLFPEVLSATLSVNPEGVTQSFTVPAQYAFAVVQVRIISGGNSENNGGSNLVLRFDCSHGTYRAGNGPSALLGNFPVLNLIIPGGSSFSVFPPFLGGSPSTTPNTVNLTALCHRRPT